MKKIITSDSILISCIHLFAFQSLQEETIVNEGKNLFRIEMASKYGMDILLEKYPEQKENIGDFFSYPEKRITKCVFVSKDINPKVIAVVSFDSTFNSGNAIIDKNERSFTSFENDIYQIKKNAFEEINARIIFATYKNTCFHLIPLIVCDSKKVFIITVPLQNGIVYFGNDYVLQFDSYNKVKSKKTLHSSIIAVDYLNNSNFSTNGAVSSMHLHIGELSDIITSTDICIIMLNEKVAKWISHITIGEKKVCIWSCETNTLKVMSRNGFDNLNKSSEKRITKK